MFLDISFNNNTKNEESEVSFGGAISAHEKKKPTRRKIWAQILPIKYGFFP